MHPDKSLKKKKSKKTSPEHMELTATDNKAHAIENYLDYGRKNSSTLLVANMLEGGIQEKDYQKKLEPSEDLPSESFEQSNIVRLKISSKDSNLSQPRKIESLINISNAFTSNKQPSNVQIDLSL